jgi:mannosylglycerate hydrolase
MFPTGLKAKYHYAEGQFDVVKREIKRIDSKDWIEQPMYDFPLHHFVDINDDKNGLALLVDGLKEYEVKDDEKRTLALTLFRAFEYIIYPSSKEDYSHKKGSQCFGKSSYRIALYPHKGNWDEGNVYQEALNFNLPIKIAQVGQSKGSLPIELSFIKIEDDNLVFSTLKKPEDNSDSMILRLYNPTDNTIDSAINLLIKPEKIERVTLEEIFIENITFVENKFLVSVPPKKIFTYKIYFSKN